MTQYNMRAYKTSDPVGYVFWRVLGTPDGTGSFSGYAPEELSNITVSSINVGFIFNNINVIAADSPYTPTLSSSAINVLNVDSSDDEVIIVLPTAPVTGVSIMIKDIMGTSETNNITVQGNGKTIDGNMDITLALNETSIWIQFNNEWVIV